MATEKDRNNVKRLIESGHISTIREIMEYYPITDIIQYLKTNHGLLTKYLNDPILFDFKKVIKIANYFNIDERKMIDLVYNQIIEDRKSKKKK